MARQLSFAAFWSTVDYSDTLKLNREDVTYMPAVVAGSPSREPFPSNRAEAEGVVKFAISKQPSIRGQDRYREARATVGGRI